MVGRGMSRGIILTSVALLLLISGGAVTASSSGWDEENSRPARAKAGSDGTTEGMDEAIKKFSFDPQTIGDDLACSACELVATKVQSAMSMKWSSKLTSSKRAAVVDAALDGACKMDNYKGYAVSGESGKRAYVDFQKMMGGGSVSLTNLCVLRPAERVCC